MIDQKYILKWYGLDRPSIDDEFIGLIGQKISSSFKVLDAGAGAGEMFRYDLKSRVAEIIGVDLDERVLTNSQLHRGIVADMLEIPVADEYFDLVFCRYVLEHITDPKRFLREMYRLLRPGGSFVFLTPNKLHYVALCAKLTPHGFHSWFNQRLRGRSSEDTFPTAYKLNTAKDIRREFEWIGFQEDALRYVEGCPNYLTFAKLPFLCGVAYERVVNAFDCLAGLRVNIIGSFVKP